MDEMDSPCFPLWHSLILARPDLLVQRNWTISTIPARIDGLKVNNKRRINNCSRPSCCTTKVGEGENRRDGPADVGKEAMNKVDSGAGNNTRKPLRTQSVTPARAMGT
ncbi:hypothetical protein SKAU_G00094620 [Synaphobranchus kaupii]|uniref:Uncharacterized protein n=1 Tax=Synaphobranchus kaupii TaxID=118154 RepID=A0A9Q1FXX9_SYNKA|nr:hypothetical protein SKAU_G00094620 [Synaphobranchus kaupii]